MEGLENEEGGQERKIWGGGEGIQSYCCAKECP